ncbi:hypothetical protein LINPERPRIM_LOCUS18770 [Linum perenne]
MLVGSAPALSIKGQQSDRFQRPERTTATDYKQPHSIPANGLARFQCRLEAEKPSSSSTIPYSHLITLCFDRLRITLRSLELFAALLLFLWISIHLPIAFQISDDFLHRFAAVMQSTLFVFLLFNAIIVAVIIKSAGRFAGQNNDDRHCLMDFDSSIACLCSEAAEGNVEVAFQDKQVIVRRRWRV